MEKYWKKTDILVSTYHSSNLTLITQMWPSSLTLCKSNLNPHWGSPLTKNDQDFLSQENKTQSSNRK